jgi:hypothetical protein
MVDGGDNCESDENGKNYELLDFRYFHQFRYLSKLLQNSMAKIVTTPSTLSRRLIENHEVSYRRNKASYLQ